MAMVLGFVRWGWCNLWVCWFLCALLKARKTKYSGKDVPMTMTMYVEVNLHGVELWFFISVCCASWQCFFATARFMASGLGLSLRCTAGEHLQSWPRPCAALFWRCLDLRSIRSWQVHEHWEDHAWGSMCCFMQTTLELPRTQCCQRMWCVLIDWIWDVERRGRKCQDTSSFTIAYLLYRIVHVQLHGAIQCTLDQRPWA